MSPFPSFVPGTALRITCFSRNRHPQLCKINTLRMTASPRDDAPSITPSDFEDSSASKSKNKDINNIENTISGPTDNTKDNTTEPQDDKQIIDSAQVKDEKKGDEQPHNVKKPVREASSVTDESIEFSDVSKDEEIPETNVNIENKNDTKTKQPEEKDNKSSTDQVKNPTIQLSPDQVEKAKAARAAATKVADEKEQKQQQKTRELLQKTEQVLAKIGTKSRAFNLGENARTRAELFVEDTISAGNEDKATQQDKVKSAAASAAKNVVAVITKTWENTIAPKIRDSLPDAYGNVSNKTLASATLGLFCAIVLFPTFFSGGGPSKETIKKKEKLDEQTVTLEKKLNRDRRTSSQYYGSKSSTQTDSVFPKDELDSPSSSVKKPTSLSSSKSTPKSSTETGSQTASSSTSSVTTNVPAPVETPKPVPPPVAPPSVVPPKPINPADVTSTMVLSSVTKALGPNASLISSASFDSLSAEPTIILEVTRAYHQLPATEQTKIAKQILDSSRKLGYESVSIVEKDTGLEVAHAGVDIDLEDESANLRAELASMRKTSDQLAIDNANEKTEIGKLQSRIDEQREEFARKQTELEKAIKNLRNENSALSVDLDDAKTEIARMPDLLNLEERTVEAEKKAEKMADSVEVLSIQLSKARSDEAQAKKSETESLQKMNAAIQEKENALESVSGQIEKAKKESQKEASDAINENKQETRLLVEEAEKKAKLSEEARVNSEKQAATTLENTTKDYEKQLQESKENNEKEVQTIQSKYEAMLDEVQRKAKKELDAFQEQADKQMSIAMKEAKATADRLVKERDQATKETEKSEANADKATAKANREKENLQSKIGKLEQKLKETETKLREKSKTGAIVAPVEPMEKEAALVE